MSATTSTAASSAASPARPVRTYGGWRRTRGIGLFGLGATGTLVVLACAVVPLVLASVSWQAFLAALPVAALVAGASVVRVGGLTAAEHLSRRARWAWARRRGWTTYRATTIDEHPRAWDLPGVLAPTRLLSVPDGRGGTFGLVWNRRTGLLTATLTCAATSTWLVDADDADGWVANWHSWLASVGYLPMVTRVGVTVETSPEAGSTLADAVLPQVRRDAPADCRHLVRELVQRSPGTSGKWPRAYPPEPCRTQ